MHITGEHGAVSSGYINEKDARLRLQRKPQRPQGPGSELAFKSGTDKVGDLLSKQIFVSAVYFGTLFIMAIFPPTAQFASRFYSVQHAQYVNGKLIAEAGPNDWAIVLSCGMAVIGLRALCVRGFMKVAPYYNIAKPKSIVRFAEQSWCVLYHLSMSCLGFYLFLHSDYSYNPASLWTNHPHISIPADVKLYYLSQVAFWLTQIYIIHAEERRKDHYQMLTHHFITSALVIGSFLHFYTRIGHLVMTTMDFVDFQLCLAKCLKYAGFTRACDVAFMLFLVGWIVFRHVFYGWQLAYTYTKAPSVILGNCKWNLDHTKYYCTSPIALEVFRFLLLCLQILTMIWFWMIIKVVIKVVRGQGAEDTRSDDED